MKRPKKLAPDGNELRPEASAQDSCTNRSPLQIASQTIEQLEAENAALRSSADSALQRSVQPSCTLPNIEPLQAENEKLRSGKLTLPLPNIENRLFDEWMATQKAFQRNVRNTMRLKGKLKEALLRNKLLEDRIMAMQLVADHKEKAQ